MLLFKPLLHATLLLSVLAKGGPGRDGDDGGGGTDGDDNGDGDGDATPTSSASPTGTSSTNTTGINPGASVNTTGLTGDSQCVTLMCISAIVNGSTVDYILQSTGAEPMGWIAMGFGSQMANSPMVIMWPNADGSITLSQRQAKAEVMPTVVSSPPRVATLSQTLSSASGSLPKFGYTIPANSDTQQSIIWAFGTTNPDSSAENAMLLQHLQSGTLTLDLTKPSSSNANAGSPAAANSGGPGSGQNGGGGGGGRIKIPLLPYQKLIIAHAVFVGIGFLILLPAGALFARLLRTFTPSWFKGHWIVQLGIAGPTIVIGVALGIASVQSARAVHFNDTHKKLGIIIFVLYIAQCSLGAVIHFIKPKAVKRRPPQNYLHAILGLSVIGLSFYQVRLGYKTEWRISTGRDDFPDGVNVAWFVLVVLVPLLYTLGLFLLPRQFIQERESRQPRPFAEDEDPDAEDVSLAHPQMVELSRRRS